MRVVSLFRYPVKSLPGHAVETMPLDDFGPQGDRRWMLVDAQGRFMTQRQWPSLSQLAVSVMADGTRVTIRLPDGRQESVVPGAAKTAVTVWRDQIQATAGEGGADDLVSDWLGQDVRLVYMAEDDLRHADPSRVSAPTRVSFADGFPFLVINQASLRQLERWTGRDLDIRRFRPNIVIESDRAFAEDDWDELTLGRDVRLQCVKPCSRCVMTTVDPDSGIPDAGQEPLRTLGRHRRSADGVIFGQNAVHRAGSAITVGDPVTSNS